MRFLVLGASGMAGHMISIYLKEQGHTVLGFTRRKVSFVPTIIGDATDTKVLRNLIDSGDFDTIINCIGILNQAAEQNKASAVFLNSYLPYFLVQITSETSTQIIHMSTDCVFSGKAGNYTENSLRDGEAFYDRTKALGELEDNKNMTFRNSIVGPDIDPQGIGLLNWFMQQNGEVNGYIHAMWTGMTTLQLAKMMEKAAEEKAHGLYNMVPDHSINKYELLKLFNKYLRNNAVVIKPSDAFVCDKTLIRTCYDFSELVPDYAVMVAELAIWMQNHKELYPHYSL